MTDTKKEPIKIIITNTAKKAQRAVLFGIDRYLEHTNSSILEPDRGKPTISRLRLIFMKKSFC